MSLYPGLSKNIAYVLLSRNWTFGVRTFRVRTFGVCPQPRECPSETNRNTSGKWILRLILSSCVGDLWEPPSLPLHLCPVFEFLSRFVQSSSSSPALSSLRLILPSESSSPPLTPRQDSADFLAYPLSPFLPNTHWELSG